jgi:transcriptional regulator with XRE-family HTH domain
MDKNERNQFKRLRYKHSLALDPEITLREMAEMTGLSPSAISKVERKGGDNTTISTIKAYRDNIPNLSYEYLFGEVPTRENKYYELGKLFPFDDNFYNNLQELLSLDENNHFVEFMLSALLHHPQELFTTLNTIFNTLYKINHIQQDKTLSSSEKTELVKMQEYIFNQSTIDFLENTIMPLLPRLFEEKNEQLANESLATQEMLNELDIDDTTLSITTTAVTVTSVIPIEPTD